MPFSQLLALFCLTGNAEEHATLSRALSQLAEVEEKIEQLHIQQVSDVIKLDFSWFTLKLGQPWVSRFSLHFAMHLVWLGGFDV